MDYNYSVFIPYDDISNKCVIINDNDSYYVYEYADVSRETLTTEYDIVYTNGYFKVKGDEYRDVLVTDCYPYITNNFYYRNDISAILINVLIISIFGLLLPCYIFSQFFKRFR